MKWLKALYLSILFAWVDLADKINLSLKKTVDWIGEDLKKDGGKNEKNRK